VQMAIQRLIGFGKKEEFKEILAILRRQNPDRIRVLCNLSCTEKNHKKREASVASLSYYKVN
ncbi:hypothetical protein, partial [Acinetobacter baumannii]|uniref:hypothetical protein n=1 Tax=Acinetobacter baumannii TaxID=470 RepID=UPI0010FDAF61